MSAVMTIDQIIEKLSEAQKLYLISHYDRKPRAGRPHGLVRRGLLRYRWGCDASMGYTDTILGQSVRDRLKEIKHG